MQRAVQRHKEGTTRVIPIILKPCGWKYSEFKVLQVLPKEGKPISRWQDPADAWFDVEEGIRKVIETLWQQEQDGQTQVIETGTLGSKDIFTQLAELPKLQTIQFHTQTLSLQSGSLFGLGKKWTRSTQSKQATQLSEGLGNGVALDIVKIPRGQFWMGSPDGEGYDRERPQHSVEVSEFWMGKYAVTQAQWTRVAAYPKVEMDLEPFPAYFKGDNRPVDQVNWEQAVEFCKRLSRRADRTYRLPSEAEWEYACRAKTTTPFCFGPTITPDLANCTYRKGLNGFHRRQTTDVGSFLPNTFGLYDTHGNVCEWCQDVWHDNYEGAPVDGSAWLAGAEDQDRRVLRGGSRFAYPNDCRSAHRISLPLTCAGISFGIDFRVVCESA